MSFYSTNNKKLSKPYEIISDDEIPTDETLKALQECGKGNSKAYTNFENYMQD